MSERPEPKEDLIYLEPVESARPASRPLWPWALGGCLGLLVLLVVLAGVGVYFFYTRAVITDRAEVERLAQEILPCDLPEDFEGEFAFTFFVFKLAFLSSADEVYLVLMSAPRGQANRSQMRRQLRKHLVRQGIDAPDEGDQQVVEFDVRDEQVPGYRQLVRVRGEETIAQWTVFVENQDEQVLIMLMGPESELTHTRVQAFLDTVK